jgi:hypothetical protein
MMRARAFPTALFDCRYSQWLAYFVAARLRTIDHRYQSPGTPCREAASRA